MPLVSVVMPVYNGEKYLPEAIDSILAQTFTDFEFIIVDDGSVDGSAAIIRSYQRRDQRIQFIQLERNEGPSAARNRGIAAASGKYIAMMDSDDISLPQRLRMQVEFLEAKPKIDGVGVGGQAVREDLTPTFTYRLSRRHCQIVFSMLVVGQAMINASVMARRELMSSEGYDQRLRIGEDTELFARLIWRRGARFANIPAPLYIYRRHENTVSYDWRNTVSPSALLVREQMLARLWHETPAGTLDRFSRMRMEERLSWLDRRAAKRDMQRLIESMIAKNWVEPGDRELLLAEMNRRLEATTPRLWQMFLHWYRYRIGRHLPFFER